MGIRIVCASQLTRILCTRYISVAARQHCHRKDNYALNSCVPVSVCSTLLHLGAFVFSCFFHRPGFSLIAIMLLPSTLPQLVCFKANYRIPILIRNAYELRHSSRCFLCSFVCTLVPFNADVTRDPTNLIDFPRFPYAMHSLDQSLHQMIPHLKQTQTIHCT